MTPTTILQRIAECEAIMSDPNVSDTEWACRYAEVQELRAELIKESRHEAE